MGENGDHKQVDEEGADERDGRLNEVVVVGLFDRVAATSVYSATLHQG
jgi:hypothetical protein